MLTFRDVQNVVIDRALRQARWQLPLDAQIANALGRQGAPPHPTSEGNGPGVLRADEQALDAPGVGLSE